MAANESSGPSFYASEQESAGANVAVLRFVTLCFNSLPLACSLRGSLIYWACAIDTGSGVIRQGTTGSSNQFGCQITPDTRYMPYARCNRHRITRTHAARTVRHACATTGYFEMVSSAMPFVRGPMNPIAAITITIAPAMNANTPNVPKPFSTAAITNDEKIAEKRLHE